MFRGRFPGLPLLILGTNDEMMLGLSFLCEWVVRNQRNSLFLGKSCRMANSGTLEVGKIVFKSSNIVTKFRFL
jgi:hypothetical protein